jgi:folate-binding protein YgfZ
MTEAVLAQYNAVRTSAGLVDLSQRGKVRATGADHLSFLHSMISNDVTGLKVNQGCYGTLLTPTGKMVAYFTYYRFEDHVLIDVESGRADHLKGALEKYIILDDVYLEVLSGLFLHYSIQGPKSADLVRRWFGVQIPEAELRAGPVNWQQNPGWVFRRSWLADKGVDIFLPGSADNGIKEELLISGDEFGLREVEDEAFQMLRLEAMVPQFGVDMSEINNPMEAGLDRAISLTKGCYVGQEVVAKATYIGGVSRRLVLLALGTADPLETGTEVISDEGRNIGQVTSGAYSPALGVTLAFAYLRRSYAAGSTPVRVRLDQERTVAATVRDGRIDL